MKIYNNKYAQLKAIKHFFYRVFENRKMLITASEILGIVMLMVLVVWLYWNNYRKDTYEILQSYEKTVGMIDSNRLNALDTAKQFIADNRNIYGVLMIMKVAQIYVDKNDLNSAINQLKNGISLADDNNIKTLINLRIARIKMQQKKVDDALRTLNAIKKDIGFSAIISDLRGEAFLNKGNKKCARNSWESGIKSNVSPALSQIMQMKINNLPV